MYIMIYIWSKFKIKLLCAHAYLSRPLYTGT